MNPTSLACLLVLLAVGGAACTHASSQAAEHAPPTHLTKDTALPPPPVIAGGYTDPGPTNAADADESAARDLAIKEIYRKFPTRARVEKVTVQTQVVAGLNYRFQVVLSGGAVYEAVVYRDLDDHMTVTSVGPVK